jgi:hypothetical protein
MIAMATRSRRSLTCLSASKREPAFSLLNCDVLVCLLRPAGVLASACAKKQHLLMHCRPLTFWPLADTLAACPRRFKKSQYQLVSFPKQCTTRCPRQLVTLILCAVSCSFCLRTERRLRSDERLAPDRREPHLLLRPAQSHRRLE